MKEFLYRKDISKMICETKDIVIYGAGVLAQVAAFCFSSEPYCCNVLAFLVSSKHNNPSSLMDRPVYETKEACAKYKDNLVISVAMEKNLSAIQETLNEYGYNNVILAGFESDLWADIRGNFYHYYCINHGVKYEILENAISYSKDFGSNDVHIYTAKCIKDRKLESAKSYPWEINIQVGAEGTDARIANVCDNSGDNISSKNKEFCELTALYWIWKNDNTQYKGLGHYRRHFNLSESEIKKIGSSNIDVILTIPIINYPSVRAIYENDHEIEDWDTLLQIIKEFQPDYYKSALDIQDGIFYYAYNMFIAKRDIFDAYCEWIFPLLFECEKRCFKHQNEYQNRYIGFLAERLFTIYFVHNWNKLKIVHAQKEFLM